MLRAERKREHLFLSKHRRLYRVADKTALSFRASSSSAGRLNPISSKARNRESPRRNIAVAVRRRGSDDGESSSAGTKKNAVTLRLGGYGVKMEADCKLPHLLSYDLRLNSASRSIRERIVSSCLSPHARNPRLPSYHRPAHPAIFFLAEFFENAPAHIRHQLQTGQFSRQITASPRSSPSPTLYRPPRSSEILGWPGEKQPRCPSFHGKAEVKRERG